MHTYVNMYKHKYLRKFVAVVHKKLSAYAHTYLHTHDAEIV